MTESSQPLPLSPRRILLTAVGSLGDLHPYLAIAQELNRRGHTAVVAAPPAMERHVRAAGVAFRPLRAIAEQQLTAELVRRVFSGAKGMEYIVRELVLPNLRQTYEDTCAAAAGADLLVAHFLTFTTRFVAETRGLPWVSTQLAPIGMLSATDPSVLPGAGWLRRLPLPAAVWRALLRLADRRTRAWMQPVDALREQLGLPDRGNPLFAGTHSTALELALFSPLLGPPQPDWPEAAQVTGFPIFEQPEALAPELEQWLAAGPPPLVFTLGSSAVWDPGAFFEESAAAARRLGYRALLLGAEQQTLRTATAGAVAIGAGGQVVRAGYGPYSRIFPRAAAVVHQGGIGTTAEALRSGRPFLVVPFGADQPDNAARAVRLGVARTLGRHRYRGARVARELRTLLTRPGYQAAAQRVSQALHAEHGARSACDALERLLGKQRTVGPAQPVRP